MSKFNIGDYILYDGQGVNNWQPGIIINAPINKHGFLYKIKSLIVGGGYSFYLPEQFIKSDKLYYKELRIKNLKKLLDG